MNKETFAKISRLVLLLIVFFYIFAVFNVRIWDPDFWWHLKTGEYIAKTKSLPTTDPFAFTSLPKDPIQPESKRIKFILSQYWIAQLLFYWVYTMFSLQGIIYMRASILTLLVFLLYRSTRREGAAFFPALLLLTPAVIVLFGFTGERPQLFSFLFSFLLIFLLEGFRKAAHPVSIDLNGSQQVSGLMYLLPVPLIMLLWSNIHGGVIIGMLLLFGYAVCETIKYLIKKGGDPLPARSLKYLIATSGAGVLFSFFNPNGFDVIPLLIEGTRSKYVSSIAETKSPFFFFQHGYSSQEGYAFFFLLTAGFFLFLTNVKRRDITDIVIFSGLAVLSLYNTRVIPFFTPVSILMIVRYGIKTLEGMNSRPAAARLREIFLRFRSAAGRVFPESLLPVLCSVLIVVVLNNGNYFQGGIRKGRYPQGAAEFLKEQRLPVNIYNPYVWGGYLLWTLYPEKKVFIDGRGLIEAVYFQSSTVRNASPVKFSGIPEWKAILNAYKIDLVVTNSVADLTGKLEPLIPAILNDNDWRLIYMDDNSLILIRDKPQYADIIGRFNLPKEWIWNEVITEASLKARDFPKKSGFYYITMGDAYLAKGESQSAMRAYLKAQRSAPGNDAINEIAIKRINMLSDIKR